MKTHDDKRRAVRHQAGWSARYSGEPDVWRECEVMDVSMTGAAFSTSEELTDRQKVVLELHVEDGTNNGIHLRGIVRNINRHPDGTNRVGLEFLPTTLIEEMLLETLLEQEAVAHR